MLNIQAVKLYANIGTTGATPNPIKVAIILEELGVPYEQQILDFSALKQEPFISLNPNGRMPALEDPNTGIVTWEVRRLSSLQYSCLRSLPATVWCLH